MQELGGKHVHTVQRRSHKGAELTFGRTSQAQTGEELSAGANASCLVGERIPSSCSEWSIQWK